MADGYSVSSAVTFFFLSLFFTPLAANVGLWFIRSPEPIVAPPGDEVVFECSLNVPAEIVRWRHMGEFMSMDHSPDSAVRRSSSAHLVVKVIDEKQAGDYQCVAWFGASALASIPAKLTLAELRPFLYQQPRHYGVSVGNTVAIDCQMPVSNPSPVIQYYHDDTRLPSTSETIPTTGTLLLVNVTTKHSGVYTCSATNYITGQTVISPVKTHLTVTNSNTPQPPRFLSTPQSLYVMQVGSNISLECSGVGSPPPKVSWRRENGSLPLERVEFRIGALRINNITRSDDDVYVCELSSGSGPTTSHRITLQVQEPPVIKKEPGNSVVEEGGGIVLECEADGVPKPVLSWLLNGESINNDSHISTSDGKLTIKQVQKRHAGIYQCFASNPVSTTFGSALLQVSPKEVTAQGNGGDPAEIEDSEFIDDNPEGPSLIPLIPPGTPGHGKKEHNRNKTKPRRKNKKRKGNAIMIPPSKPNITRLSDKSVMVRWSVPTNNGLPIQFFKVQYRELGIHNRRSRWMTSNEDIAPHIRSYEVDGLETDRTYRFRIAAVYSNNDNKLGQNSAKFYLHRGSPSNKTPLSPPSLTETMAISPTAIQIHWQYLNSVIAPVDGFYVYYRATTNAGDYVKATVEGESTRSYNITHLQSDTAYDIKLQAFTVGAASDFSKILTRKTMKEPNATAIPELENNISGTGLGSPGNDSSNNGQMYVVIGAAAAGLALLLTLILLICLCNKHRSNGNNNEGGEDCDKTGGRGREPGLTIQQLDPVVNINGFTHNGKTNGYVPHPINITSNPLAESQQDKNVMEMSYMSSQNNNCSSDGPSEEEIAGESCEKLTWRTREGRVGENYV